MWTRCLDSGHALRAAGADSAAGRRRLPGVGASRLPRRRSPSGPRSSGAPRRCAPSWPRSRRQGYLTHPHTSAGRVPTDAGYRRYVDLLLASGALPAETRVELELSRLRREVDEAMRETTAALAQVTDLVALATAPPLATRDDPPGRGAAPAADQGGGGRDRLDRRRRQRVFEFDRPVDPGLVEWASSYLNESLAGLGVGSRMIAGRLADPELDRIEARVPRHARRRLHRARAGDRRRPLHGRRLAAALRSAPRRPAARRRADDRARAPRRRAADAALGARRALGLPLDRRREPAAGAALGQRRRRQLRPRPPQPRLGRRGRPLRMDYATAIASVRGAARELSRYFETVYDG